LILLHAASSTQNDNNARERKDMGEAPESRGGDVAVLADGAITGVMPQA
jgi:hypothetical protein